MPDGSNTSEAAVIADSLRGDFGVPVKWLEGASDNSENAEQNAALSAEILRQADITKILLVTDALHMMRMEKEVILSMYIVTC